MTAAARIDADGFLLALSSYRRDRDWSVRANLADVLATLPADQVAARVEDLAADADVRVQGPALRALARSARPTSISASRRRSGAGLCAARRGRRARRGAQARRRRRLARAAYARGESDATDAARTRRR